MGVCQSKSKLQLRDQQQQEEAHANELKKQREKHDVIVAALVDAIKQEQEMKVAALNAHKRDEAALNAHKRDEAALMRCHLATLLREAGRGTQ